MKTFKQFMTELFNTSIPYKSKGVLNPKRGPYDSEIHGYSFSVPSKDKKQPETQIDVEVHHDRDKTGRVIFKDSGSTEKTGKMGSKAPQVLANVARIADAHARKHKLERIAFSSSRDDESRMGLYDKLSKRFGGGAAPPEQQGITQKSYIVPVKKQRGTK